MIDFSKIEFKETPSIEQFATRIRGGIILTAEVTIQDGFEEIDGRKFAREEVRRMLNHKVYGELREPLAELVNVARRSPDFETVQRIEKLNFEILRLLSLK